MSDDWIQVIPTEPAFVPTNAAAERACALLAKFAPVGSTSSVALVVDVGHIEFVDSGANFSAVRCPWCRASIDLEWWSDRMDTAWFRAFENLLIRTPCCDVATSLNDLEYDWPQGFARWRLEVMNPLVGQLDRVQVAALADAIGHEVRIVNTHL